jgi:predicted Rossmann fold nucleotide-binding protein DprA/Smf involved in DNA uptake
MSELIDTSAMTPPQVMTALTELELTGAIKCGPGQTYILC